MSSLGGTPPRRPPTAVGAPASGDDFEDIFQAIDQMDGPTLRRFMARLAARYG